MQVGLNKWQAFKDHIAQSYRCYQIHNKATAADHGHGYSSDHSHGTDTQVISLDALKSLVNETMEDKNEMSNLTSINLKLSQSITQAQETILVLSKHIQALQAHTNSKKPATEKPATDNKQYIDKSGQICL